jgi:hypothetical protein
MTAHFTKIVSRHARVALLLTMAGVNVPSPVLALGTIAGTDIDNTAMVSYEVAGTPQTTTSNTVTLTVAEVLDVDVTLLSGPASTAAGATGQDLLLVVTNTGNGTESFSLTIDNTLGGDDFDPVATPAATFQRATRHTIPVRIMLRSSISG